MVSSLSIQSKKWTVPGLIAGRVIAWSIVAVVETSVTAAQADEATSPLVMLASTENAAETEGILSAAITSLQDLKVGVLPEYGDCSADNFKTSADTLLRELSPTAVFGVVTVESGHQLRLAFLNNNKTEILIRDIGQSTTDGIAEAVSLILRSWVEVLISSRPEKNETTMPAEKSLASLDEETPPSVENAGPNPSSADVSSVPQRRDTSLNHTTPPKRVFDKRLGLFAAFRTTVFAAMPPSFGIPFCVDVRGFLDFHLYVGYETIFHSSVQTDTVSLDIKHHPAVLGAGYMVRARRVGIPLSLGVTIDYAVSKISSNAPDITPINTSKIEISIDPSVGVLLPISHFFAIHALFGAKIMANRTRYFVFQDFEKKEVFLSWPIQPFFQIGLSSHFF
jgi:hypothetical protein